MKIKAGDTLEEITLPKPDGTLFNLSETKGKKVLLTFYRVAGCTFCNLRLMELKRRFSELGDDFTHVGIFHAPVSALKSTSDRHGGLPFTILADEKFEYFEKYDVERSWSKLLIAALVKSFLIFPAVLKGFLPIPFNGHFNIAVTDVLINQEGVVEEVYYAQRDAADHFEFAKVKSFALS